MKKILLIMVSFLLVFSAVALADEYAAIKSGFVRGVYVYDEQPQPISGVVWVNISLLPIKPGPKWTHDGEVFSPPPPVVVPDNKRLRALRILRTVDVATLKSNNSGKVLLALVLLLLDVTEADLEQ